MIYAISDLHGYPFEKFKELLSKADFSANDFLFVLGDVIDRGTDGIKLLKWMMLQSNVELLMGNHEQMMLDCEFILEEINDKSLSDLNEQKLSSLSNWIANGASPTVKALQLLNDSARKYIYEYLYDAEKYEYVTAGDRDFILTHSGLGNFSPERKLSDYTGKELLWNRPKISDRYFNDKTVVFGHTPTVNYGDEYKGIIIRTDTWVNIDAGAGWGYDPVLLRLDDMKTFTV